MNAAGVLPEQPRLQAGLQSLEPWAVERRGNELRRNRPIGPGQRSIGRPSCCDDRLPGNRAGDLPAVVHGTYLLQHRLTEEVAKSTALQKQSEIWRVDARRYVDGLARAINEQLTRWNLTVAEKEVTFLLLKGLGFKEIAMVRNTSERTARAQSTAIYAKAGLSGRTELAAFFLEDLLLPQET
ncbi:MAG: response regulator transcription factor [Proteobacteria bacterium]|nr:response regulator transcription factor [Pseudomonadota bacterium]